MLLPLPPPVAGVMPVTSALVHVYVGEGVVLELVMLYVFDTLLHQLAVAGLVTTAVGLTVTVANTEKSALQFPLLTSAL